MVRVRKRSGVEYELPWWDDDNIEGWFRRLLRLWLRLARR